MAVVRGEPEVSSTEITASEQLQPTPSTAVVSGKRQRDEPQVTERYEGQITVTYMYICRPEEKFEAKHLNYWRFSFVSNLLKRIQEQRVQSIFIAPLESEGLTIFT